MQLRYVVMGDQQQPLHVRSIDVDEEQDVADLLALIQAQLQHDSPSSGGELTLYRAQKHGDHQAPWMREGDGDFLALSCGDKDVDAAFCAESTLLEPNQRLGDVFGSLNRTTPAPSSTAVATRETTSSATPRPTSTEHGGRVRIDAQTSTGTLVQLTTMAAMVVAMMFAVSVSKLASQWTKAIAACVADVKSCEERLIFWTATVFMLFIAVYAVLALSLHVKMLRALCTDVTPREYPFHISFWNPFMTFAMLTRGVLEALSGTTRWLYGFSFALVTSSIASNAIHLLRSANDTEELNQFLGLPCSFKASEATRLLLLRVKLAAECIGMRRFSTHPLPAMESSERPRRNPLPCKTPPTLPCIYLPSTTTPSILE